MDRQGSVADGPSYRKAGLAAIVSGLIGISAFALLMTAVTTRVTWIPSDRVWILFNAHDIGVACQFLLLIPVVFGLRTLSQQNPAALVNATCSTGVGALIFVVLLVLLGIGEKIVSNSFYTFPQGVFGVWLIVVNWRQSGSSKSPGSLHVPLPRWLRGFGMIVGLGLALTGVAFVGIAFVYPDLLAIPAVPTESVKPMNSPANTFFHQLLLIGTLMGVATLPIWTLLTGLQLLKKRGVLAAA
jgi:hypothetical protein